MIPDPSGLTRSELVVCGVLAVVFALCLVTALVALAPFIAAAELAKGDA